MDPHERRRLILDRSAEIFARKGIAATTIREIGDAVGVYSGALYHYFPSKEAIVTELIREYVEDLDARCRGVLARELPPRERLVALTEAAMSTSEKYQGATSIWRREGEYMRQRVVEGDLTSTADGMQDAWRGAIADGIAAGELRDDIDPEVFRELLYDAVWHVARWFTPDSERDLRALAETVIRIFVDGMRPRPA